MIFVIIFPSTSSAELVDDVCCRPVAAVVNWFMFWHVMWSGDQVESPTSLLPTASSSPTTRLVDWGSSLPLTGPSWVPSVLQPPPPQTEATATLVFSSFPRVTVWRQTVDSLLLTSRPSRLLSGTRSCRTISARATTLTPWWCVRQDFRVPETSLSHAEASWPLQTPRFATQYNNIRWNLYGAVCNKLPVMSTRWNKQNK